jgi:hypothetical protein
MLGYNSLLMQFETQQLDILILPVHLLLQYGHLCLEPRVLIFGHIHLQLKGSLLLHQVFFFNPVYVNLLFGLPVRHYSTCKK